MFLYITQDKIFIHQLRLPRWLGGNGFNGRSIFEGREYGSSIYENGNGYSYTEPNKGTNDGVIIPLTSEGTTRDSYVHSHGKYVDEYNNDVFSSIPLKDIWGRLVEKSKNGVVSKFKYDHFGRLVEKLEGETLKRSPNTPTTITASGLAA